MTEESPFEVYLIISYEKYEIYLLDKINLKNIYKEEIYIENNIDLIDYNLLNSFLDKNIFKIEKLIGNFVNNIYVLINDYKIFNLSFGIKKKNYQKTIKQDFLNFSLFTVDERLILQIYVA